VLDSKCQPSLAHWSAPPVAFCLNAAWLLCYRELICMTLLPFSPAFLRVVLCIASFYLFHTSTIPSASYIKFSTYIVNHILGVSNYQHMHSACILINRRNITPEIVGTLSLLLALSRSCCPIKSLPHPQMTHHIQHPRRIRRWSWLTCQYAEFLLAQFVPQFIRVGECVRVP